MRVPCRDVATTFYGAIAGLRFHEEASMFRTIRSTASVFGFALLSCVATLHGQQKPQWMPGQLGLNAGVAPAPGFTYANVTVNYRAGRFNGPNGSAIPVTGSYNVWAVANLFYGVLDPKFLHANLYFALALTPASGSLDADLATQNPGIPDLNAVGGGGGLADTFVEPVGLAWHLKRVDVQIAEAMMVPTGRYSPGATNNVGTGYFGNHVLDGVTYYVTKNRATSANVFTDWEVHGERQGTNGTVKTPGQAFTIEWGLGQVVPLKKNFSQLLQVGLIGYDQWQITDNSGTVPIGSTGLTIPASSLPRYSVHAIGGQATYIVPAKNLTIYFKGEHEYTAYSHFVGNTIVFGGTWTLPIPKPALHTP
jgi:hypothetical protein